MANILIDSYPALTKKNNWEIPSEEVVIPQATNQLGNFLAQKVAAAQPVKVEANPEFMQAIPQTAAPVTGVEPAITQTPIVPIEPTSNALVAQQQGVQQQVAPPTAPPMQTLEPSEHEKYWGNKVFGKIPLDQFVQMAGMLANSFNPDDPLGKQLAAMGGEAYKERMKREYEGPNKLLERRLKQEQLSGRVAGNEVRANLNNFIENWPAEAERLKGLGYSDEAIRREYTKGVTRITAMGSGLKGAALEEKVTARQEGIDTRRAGQAITGRVADARIAKMGSDAARAERGLRLREKKAVGGKAGTGEEGFGKVVKILVNPQGIPITVYQKKGEEAKYRVKLTDGTSREATPDELQGITGVGTPPRKKEESEKEKITRMIRQRMELNNINAKRKKQGLPPLDTHPENAEPVAKPTAPTAKSAVKVITATNPKTGQKLMLVNGKWVPMTKGEQ